MTKSEVINILKIAQAGRFVVTIVYQKLSTKRYVKRQVEPYEMRKDISKNGSIRDFLYAYDISPAHKRKGSIKKWLLDNISNVMIDEKNTFKERWPVKIPRNTTLETRYA